MTTALGATAVSIEPETETQEEPSTGRVRRIGLLGGTFDPPHVGHLVLGTIAAEAAALDRVLFVPAGTPPHKRRATLSSATDRLLMTRLAIAGDPCFGLSAIEVERGGVSYTVDTLEQLHQTYGDDVELYLVMAADSLAQAHGWRDPLRILDLAEWVVGPRPGTPTPTREELTERFGARQARIHVVDGPGLAVSSSELRARVAIGRSIRYLVPAAVADHIAARGLYRAMEDRRR
ncbi:MAG: nicotinate-nucleotide adenylyltransferase [Chloroflexota bacterium]|nr:nicotinate-nucleotide adenylyltransferase [Chloroflexota bacterium]